MTAHAGVDLILSVGTGSPLVYTAFGGITSNNLSGKAGAIKITNVNSANWEEVLDGGGIKAFTVSGSGVAMFGSEFATVEDNFLSQTLTNFKITVGSGGTPTRSFTGLFKITAFDYKGAVGGAIDFSISLESSGPVVIVRNP